mmetsp:Transcript_31265/g.82034  ORF Transcript_31265/g.82034 Transcript_31265/m.82034 type:complete len:87 (+) Transcript_31265:205-465(+)
MVVRLRHSCAILGYSIDTAQFEQFEQHLTARTQGAEQTNEGEFTKGREGRIAFSSGKDKQILSCLRCCVLFLYLISLLFLFVVTKL